jgi:hypothetical protein
VAWYDMLIGSVFDLIRYDCRMERDGGDVPAVVGNAGVHEDDDDGSYMVDGGAPAISVQRGVYSVAATRNVVSGLLLSNSRVREDGCGLWEVERCYS